MNIPSYNLYIIAWFVQIYIYINIYMYSTLNDLHVLNRNLNNRCYEATPWSMHARTSQNIEHIWTYIFSHLFAYTYHLLFQRQSLMFFTRLLGYIWRIYRIHEMPKYIMAIHLQISKQEHKHKQPDVSFLTQTPCGSTFTTSCNKKLSVLKVTYVIVRNGWQWYYI